MRLTLCEKGQKVTYTLAYYASQLITAVKGFIVQGAIL
jgi:hypothetical protein